MSLTQQLTWLLDTTQSEKDYIESVQKSGIFENTVASAYPQTVTARLVREHFTDTDCGKRKKALIVGFDGARADGMLNLVKSRDPKLDVTNENSPLSAVCAVKEQGGLYLTYAGGEPGDRQTKQDTSTAPGWASVLTGVWAREHGVYGMETMNSAYPTALLELARRGVSACFYGLWETHFANTYKGEIETAQKERLPLEYLHCKSENDLHGQLLRAIDADVDCIFGVYEGPDSCGHGVSFTNNNYLYKKSISDCDRCAYELMERIRARDTYENEDWLILITSDHGGHKRRHGTQKIQDRMTFLASSKRIETL